MSSSSSSVKLSLAFALLLTGLVVLGEVGGAGAIDCATVRCMQPGHITCANYPGKELEGCACVCAPDDGHGCVLYRQDGSTAKCGKKQ